MKKNFNQEVGILHQESDEAKTSEEIIEVEKISFLNKVMLCHLLIFKTIDVTIYQRFGIS